MILSDGIFIRFNDKKYFLSQMEEHLFISLKEISQKRENGLPEIYLITDEDGNDVQARLNEMELWKD